MKIAKKITALLAAAAVAGVSVATMATAVSADEEGNAPLTAYLCASIGAESAWGPGEMSGVSPTLTGDGQYTVSVTCAEGSESIELLLIEVENLNLYDFAPDNAAADAYGMPAGCTVGFTVDSIQIERAIGGTDAIAYNGPSDGAYRASDDGATLRMNILNTWGNGVADIDGDLSSVGGMAAGDTLSVTFTITGIDEYCAGVASDATASDDSSDASVSGDTSIDIDTAAVADLVDSIVSSSDSSSDSDDDSSDSSSASGASSSSGSSSSGDSSSSSGSASSSSSSGNATTSETGDTGVYAVVAVAVAAVALGAGTIVAKRRRK